MLVNTCRTELGKLKGTNNRQQQKKKISKLLNSPRRRMNALNLLVQYSYYYSIYRNGVSKRTRFLTIQQAEKAVA